MKQLVSVKLINFQSWVEKSGDMTFAPDVLNVIKGRNETGKSVLFKVIYEMCFHGYHDIKCLIRRGYDQALAYFEYSDGYQVLFQAFRNGGRVYFLQGPNDEQPRQWQQSDIPDEIVDAMGLIISRENQIILNVLDKDVPMPFVKTDPKYNASVLKSKLEPEELTRYFERSKDYVKRIQEALARHAQQANYWNTKQSALSYVDVQQLKAERLLLDSRTMALEAYTKLFNCSADIANLDEAKPVYKEYPLASLNQQLEILRALIDLSQALGRLNVVLSEQPSPPAYSQEEMIKFDSNLNSVRKLLDIKNKLSEFSQLIEPEQIEIPVELDQNFEIVNSLMKVKQSILAVSCIEAPVIPEIPEGVQEELNTLKTAQDAFYNLSLVFERTQRLTSATKDFSQLCSELKMMEDKLSICPTCGRPFHE